MEHLDDSRDAAERKPMHFFLVALLSIPLAGAGYVVDQTVRWTDHLHGFVNGLIHLIYVGIAWPIYMGPWCLCVYFSFRKRESKRFQTLWILGPAILLSLVTLAGLVLQPPNAARRFEAFTKARLPENLSELRTHFSGGGVTDYGDTYYFKTTSSEIDRLIREMKMEEETFSEHGFVWTHMKQLPGGPDFKNWNGASQYQWFDSKRHWFSYLITDAAKTQAYIFVGCT